MFKNPGTKWPIIIALSIVGIIAACVATIQVALKNPVQMSDYGLQNYHDYDANVNEIIAAKIAFDQKYVVAFLTPQISEKGNLIRYRIADKRGNPVENAQIEAVMTRPDTNSFDVPLTLEKSEGGEYLFRSVDLPKAGRWDILAKITVGDDTRYYNLKADTRNSNTFEF